MKSVALHNLGCKVNSYEMEVMQQKLSENGYKIVPFAPGADIYLINTCTVTNIADRKSRQMLHKAKKMNPKAVVVAIGCYVQTGEAELKKDECIDLVIGNNKKKDVVEILQAYLESRQNHENFEAATVIDINHTDEYEEMTLRETAEHTRAYIKIQDGCNQFCSYCAIPYARGRVRSRQEQDILNEIKGLVSSGYQEVVITGIHLSSYGLDFIDKTVSDYMSGEKDVRELVYKREFLLNLLKKIQEIDGLKRIRLGSLEPRIITEQFAKGLASLDKICPHFHLSLQSGCDSTLKSMNRHYTTEDYFERVNILRQYFKNAAITTDIITGFPGESDDDFETTYQYAKKVNFYEVHVFKYSKRKGTPAAVMKDQLSEALKESRSSRLLALTRQQSKEFRNLFMKQNLEVLLEEEKFIDGTRYMVGHTPHYVLCAVKTEENLSNCIILGRTISFLQDDILLISDDFCRES